MEILVFLFLLVIICYYALPLILIGYGLYISADKPVVEQKTNAEIYIENRLNDEPANVPRQATLTPNQGG